MGTAPTYGEYMLSIDQPGAISILLVTLGTSLLGLYRLPWIIERSLFRPYWYLRRKQYDTIYLSGFVHADMSHLLFNMFTFYFFAFPLERFIGTVRFLVLYAAGLIVSHACTYFKQRDNVNYASLGASGAISAVLFAIGYAIVANQLITFDDIPFLPKFER